VVARLNIQDIVSHIANIPIANVLVKRGANTFVDIVGNTNTAIAKNTTKISDLKDQVDIDGSGFDVVLTSWNVSHVSDASKAFYNTPSFNQYIGDWDVRATLECCPPRLGVTTMVY
jgi:hypothetical protein